MSECDGKCGSCSVDGCDSRIVKEKPAEGVTIKKVIGVVSGKGGVGKSLVTSLLAVELQRQGYKVGILDADIIGPSIPKSFNINSGLMSDGQLIYPALTKNNIAIVSSNLLIENEETAILWRGSMVSGLIKQFFNEVNRNELDYLFIDMPPGTGDVALTVFQSLPVDGIVIVSTPQSLVSMIVGKAFNMAEKMEIPVYGLIENMSYVKCKDCDSKNYIFGESKAEEIAKKYNTEVLGQIPLTEGLSKLVDEGQIEDANVPEMKKIVDTIIKKTK